jgi:hypothetical protein
MPSGWRSSERERGTRGQGPELVRKYPTALAGGKLPPVYCSNGLSTRHLLHGTNSGRRHIGPIFKQKEKSMYAEEQPVQSPQTSKGAIWSFVLSLVGLVFCCSFASIPAVICGHVAMPKIKRSGGLLTGSGFAIAGLVIGYITIVLHVISLPTAISAVRASARRAACVNNMRKVGIVLTQYAQDHQGHFPNDLQALVPEYANQGDLNPEMFVAPGSGTQPGDMMTISQWTDFVLVPNRKTSDPADSILLFTKPDCYRDGKGIVVLYVDMHPSIIRADEYNRLMRGLDASK